MEGDRAPLLSPTPPSVLGSHGFSISPGVIVDVDSLPSFPSKFTYVFLSYILSLIITVIQVILPVLYIALLLSILVESLAKGVSLWRSNIGVLVAIGFALPFHTFYFFFYLSSKCRHEELAANIPFAKAAHFRVQCLSLYRLVTRRTSIHRKYYNAWLSEEVVQKRVWFIDLMLACFVVTPVLIAVGNSDGTVTLTDRVYHSKALLVFYEIVNVIGYIIYSIVSLEIVLVYVQRCTTPRLSATQPLMTPAPQMGYYPSLHSPQHHQHEHHSPHSNIGQHSHQSPVMHGYGTPHRLDDFAPPAYEDIEHAHAHADQQLQAPSRAKTPASDRREGESEAVTRMGDLVEGEADAETRGGPAVVLSPSVSFDADLAAQIERSRRPVIILGSQPLEK